MVAIVIPTYNEHETLPRVLDGIFGLNLADVQVVIVDDASTDGTAEVAAPRATVLSRAGVRGLGSALVFGFQHALRAGADIIVEMDADGSHDPREIPALLTALAEGADVAIGSRRIVGGRIIGWSVWRQAMSWGAMTAARLVLGLKTQDVTNGFRAYRRAALLRVGFDGIKSSGYAFQEELLYRLERAALRVVEIPTTFRDRTAGQSKLTGRDIAEFFITLIRLRI